MEFPETCHQRVMAHQYSLLVVLLLSAAAGCAAEALDSDRASPVPVIRTDFSGADSDANSASGTRPRLPAAQVRVGSPDPLTLESMRPVLTAMNVPGPDAARRVGRFVLRDDAQALISSAYQAAAPTASADRRLLVHLATETRGGDAVPFLEKVALSAWTSRERTPDEPDDGTDGGADEPSPQSLDERAMRLRAVVGLSNKDAAGVAGAKAACDRVLRDGEFGVVQMLALHLFVRGKLSSERRRILDKRSIFHGFRKLTTGESDALRRFDPETAPGRAQARNRSTLTSEVRVPPPRAGASSHVHSQGACGVASPPGNQGDGEVDALWGCTQTQIDDMWDKYSFGAGNWSDGGWGYSEPCNDDLPLKRTFNALQVLKWCGTDAPHCDTSTANPLTWAYCWAGNALDETKASCSTASTARTTYGPLQSEVMELRRPFFYGWHAVNRASTVVHEARHASGWCGHTSDCPYAARTGKDRTCDPRYGHGDDDGCHGTGSGGGMGPFGLQAAWMWWFATNARDEWASLRSKKGLIDRVNTILNDHFDEDPCFRLDENGNSYSTCPPPPECGGQPCCERDPDGSCSICQPENGECP